MLAYYNDEAVMDGLVIVMIVVAAAIFNCSNLNRLAGGNQINLKFD